MMKSIQIPVLFVIIILLSMTNCKSQDTLIYFYADGNSNSYIIKNLELEYKPVKPIESSSGLYDGGDPKTVILTQAEFDKIIAAINSAIENKSMQIDQRVMMSGMIIVENKKGKKAYILGTRSQSKYEIEKLLKEIMDKKP